ncbi:MAG: SurA N-terminal domain-containing protein [Victivallaceae bacterium]|nr:SurA N-terminal domain-containing protein [Victivallaceae bacterium]
MIGVLVLVLLLGGAETGTKVSAPKLETGAIVLAPKIEAKSSVSGAKAKDVSAPEIEVESILASVNGEAITLSDVLSETRQAEWRITHSFGGDEAYKAVKENRREVVDELIDRKLILAAYKAKPFAIPEKYVDAALNEMALSYGCRTRLEFAKKLRENHSSLDELAQSIREILIVRTLMTHHVDLAGKASPREIHEYFVEHGQEFQEESALKLSLLFLSVKNAQYKQALEAIDRALAIDPGKFGELVLTYSDAANRDQYGDIGFIEYNNLRKEFREALLDKPVAGKVVGPFKLPEGVYYVQITFVRPGRKADFAAHREAIQTKLNEQKRKAALELYRKELRENAVIRYFF